jgi:hypothetical protein
VDVVDLVAQGQILERQALDASPDVSDRSQGPTGAAVNQPRASAAIQSICDFRNAADKQSSVAYFVGSTSYPDFGR